MTNTPIHEQLSQHFEEVRKNAYKRGRLETQIEILDLITSMTNKKMTWIKAAETLIKAIENNNK